jgi:hypothetical protein
LREVSIAGQTMHESVSRFQKSTAYRYARSAAAIFSMAIALSAGCQNPFGRKAVSCGCAVECDEEMPCGEEIVCGNCGEVQPPHVLSQYACGLPYCTCDHLKAFGRVPCEKCGCLLHFCEDSDYVGPIEPPRPPRFHPVPTQPVFAHGLPPVE